IDATNETSPWNVLVRDAFSAFLPRAMGGGVPLGNVAARDGRTAEILAINETVSSAPIGSGAALRLRLPMTVTIQIDFAEASRSIVIPTPITYRVLYQPLVQAAPRGSGGLRRLVANWDSSTTSADIGAVSWDPRDQLGIAGLDRET